MLPDRRLPPHAGSFESGLTAHVVVALAMVVHFGSSVPVADALVVAAVVVLGAGLLATRAAGRTWPGPETMTWGVVLGCTLAVLAVPAGDALAGGSPLAFSMMGVGATCVVASYAIDLGWGPPPVAVQRARPAVLLAIALGLGVWVLRASPSPLGVGLRPHLADGAAPLKLVLGVVGIAAGGDARRVSLLATLAGAGALRVVAARSLGRRRSALPDLLLAAVAFHPRGLFALEQGWDAPLALPLLTGFALALTPDARGEAGTRRRDLAAVLLGLLGALNPAYVWCVPALLLVPGLGSRGVVIALGTLVAAYAPFAIGAKSAFWNGLVLHPWQALREPSTPDSLSLTSLLAAYRIDPPWWSAFAAGVASLGALFVVPRQLGPLLLAAAFTLLVVLAMGRQTSGDLYVSVGAMCLLACASLPGDARPRS